MTQKPKLSAGQRIKFVGPWLRYDGDKPVGGIAFAPTTAEVYMVGNNNAKDQVRVKASLIDGWISRRQVTHVLRPKKKPDKERVERWLYMDSYGKEKCVDSRSHCEAIAKRTDANVAYVRLLEVKPDEVVLSRQELARACADTGISNRGEEALAVALGLGKDKA